METWNEVVNFTVKAVKSKSKAFERDAELDAETLEAEGDMLSRWSALMLSGKMSSRDIIVHLSANVFAGSDTTAIAARAVFYFLMKNPDKMKKLQQQIDEADKAGRLKNAISYKETMTYLPYLEAVIKEAMRLHPSVGLILERHVPPSGATICGQHMPGGTVVGINAWVLHHDPSVYESPNSFWPERWLEASPEKLRDMEQSFFAWGSGSRTCMGKNMALIALHKIVPLVLREFDLTIEGDWKTTNKWFVQQEGLVVRVKERVREI